MTGFWCPVRWTQFWVLRVPLVVSVRRVRMDSALGTPPMGLVRVVCLHGTWSMILSRLFIHE